MTNEHRGFTEWSPDGDSLVTQEQFAHLIDAALEGATDGDLADYARDEAAHVFHFLDGGAPVKATIAIDYRECNAIVDVQRVYVRIAQYFDLLGLDDESTWAAQYTRDSVGGDA